MIAQSVNAGRKAYLVSVLLSIQLLSVWGNIYLLVYSFFLFFIGHHTGSKSTRTDLYGSNFQIGKTVLAEHGCSSLLGHFVLIYPMKLKDACANFTPEGTNSSYS